VAFEIIFSRMAGLRQNELRRRSDERVAAANARAEEAQLKTEQLRKAMAWRRLEDDAFFKLIGRVKGNAHFVYVDNDPESFHFAVGLQVLLARAGWTVSAPQPIPYRLQHGALMIPSNVPVSANGVTITVPSLEEADREGTAFNALEKALREQLGSVFARRDESVSSDRLLVVIAPKE
jgi:hypothetical protein